VLAARIVGVDGKEDLGQSNKRLNLEEKNATDVLLKPGLATPTNAHEIVNGLRTRNGVNVQSRVMGDPKTEQEHCNKLQLMEEWIVLEKRLNSETVICRAVQLIANGALGLIGICAPEAVAEACKEELALFKSRNEMAENDVKETRCKCETVTCNRVRYAKIAPVTQLSVHNGQPIAPTVHSFRDAVEKRAICAETLTLENPNRSSI